MTRTTEPSWGSEVGPIPGHNSALTSRENTTTRLAHIQGLRAIAVLAVMAYHADGLLPGGFTGVDIFFVISGYVVTCSALRSRARNEFKVGSFLLRRARRLIPQMAFATTFSLAAFTVVFPPESLWVSARTSLAAQSFIANLDIARTTGQYFAASANLNGFLHYWSLSVEEQFYLIFPLLFFAFFVSTSLVAKRTAAAAALLLGVISLALSLFPDLRADILPHYLSGYYSPLPRLWQFLIGTSIAIVPLNVRAKARWFCLFCGVSGLTLMVSGLFVVGSSAAYPDVGAALPTLGAALFLWPVDVHNDFLRRALSLRTFQFVGKLSYSLYLWHWPAAVIAEHLDSRSTSLKLCLIVLSAIPAVCSSLLIEYRYVGRTNWKKRQVFGFSLTFVALPLFVAAGIFVPARNGAFPARALRTVSADLEGSFGSLSYFEIQEGITFPCSKSLNWEHLEFEGFERCRQTRPGDIVDVALIGDSHAEHLFLGLASLEGMQNVAYYIQVKGPIPEDPNMQEIISHVVADRNIKSVLISSAWTRGRHLDPRFAETFRSLLDSDKDLFVIGDVPQFSIDPYGCANRILWLFGRNCDEAIPSYLASNFELQEQLFRQGLPRGAFIDLSTVFCNQNAICSMESDGQLLYRDDNHLNELGSQLVAESAFARHKALRHVLGLK